MWLSAHLHSYQLPPLLSPPSASLRQLSQGCKMCGLKNLAATGMKLIGNENSREYRYKGDTTFPAGPSMVS